MQLFGILLPLLGLVCFAAWIWLLVVAFKRSPVWGVLVFLLSPISAIVFAVKYWGDAKRPFLVYTGSTAALVAGLVIMVASAGAAFMEGTSAALEAGMQPTELNAAFEEPGDADPPGDPARIILENAAGGDPRIVMPGARTDGGAAPAANAEPPAANTMPASPPALAITEPADPAENPRDVVALRDLDKYVGELLRVVTSEGVEFEGQYVGREGEHFEFEKRLKAGTLAVYLNKNELRTVHRIRQW